MKQLFLMVDNGEVRLLDTPAPTGKEGYLLVETMYSAVSAGTERTLSSFGEKNLIQKAIERPDQVQKVMEKMKTDGILTTVESTFNRLKEPMPIGYSAVGRVLEAGSGVTDIFRGDLVAMAGQAYHSEINRVNRNLVVKLPEELEDVSQAAFCALGGIALEGIHQAKVIPGEAVGIIGMGLLGHITARILRAYGCDVIGYDVVDKTLSDTVLLAFIKSDDDNAVEKTKALTRDRGVDKVIITAATAQNTPMDLAAGIVRDRGIICMIGVTKMDIDRRPYYEKELTFTLARSYGPGRYDSNYEEKGIDYPIGQVRFTEGRNLEEFVRLLANKSLKLKDLITHIIDFEDAADAYEMITTNKNKEKYIGILLKYRDDSEKTKKCITCKKSENAINTDRITVGIIGAGNFTKNTMLPIMNGLHLFQFRTLCTTGGVNAAQANSMYPFEYLTNDYHDLLEDEKIDLIIISTGHNSHAKLIIEALSRNKHVYCEKPLCLTLKELDEIETAYEKSQGELFCGLNRRFSPFVRQIKKNLATDKAPAMYEYVANAGYIPPQHWVQDVNAGGGRIIGEACHFLDTLQYLDGGALQTVTVNYVKNNAFPSKDNCMITAVFESGSVGNIIYTSMGSKKYAKEELKVISSGKIMVLDNYVNLYEYGTSRIVKHSLKQDKGFRAEYQNIYQVLKGKKRNDMNQVFVGHRKLIGACGNES